MTEDDNDVTTPPAPTTRGRKWVTWAIVGVLVAAFVGCSVLVSSGNGGGSGDEKFSARKACEEFVERHLKAPATAEFSGTTVSGAPSTYTVSGTVDAENSFGAKLRMTYACRTTKSGDTWILQSLTGLDD